MPAIAMCLSMIEPIMVDTRPLGRQTNAKAKREIIAWHDTMLAAGHVLIVPEVSDYEVRRSLLLHQYHESLVMFDLYKHSLKYQPITTRAMLKAAELWGDARRRGKSTA